MHCTHSMNVWFACLKTPLDWGVKGIVSSFKIPSDFRYFANFLMILTASICMKSTHLLAWLHSSKSLPFFEFLQGFWLVLQYVLIWMPYDMANDEQHIMTSSYGCFERTVYVWVHSLLRLSYTRSRMKNGLSNRFPLNPTLAIALPGWSRIVGDGRKDLQAFECKVCQAAVPCHLLLSSVPTCILDCLKCQQAAVVFDISVFGWFRSHIQNAIQNEKPIGLRCSHNQLPMAIAEVETVVI